MKVNLVFVALCCLVLAVDVYSYRPKSFSNFTRTPTMHPRGSILDFGSNFGFGQPCPNRNHRRDQFRNCYDPNESVDY